MNTKTRLPAGFFFCVLQIRSLMATSFDFTIVKSSMSGISEVVPQNEDAFRYLVDETDFSVFADGTTVLFNERIGDFISDAGHKHLCCDLV